MFAKLLKRYHSRTALNETSMEIIEEEKTTTQASTLSSSVDAKIEKIKNSQDNLPLQYRYQRPDLIGSYTAEELTHFASHGFRPVVPGNPAYLPDGVGYAEAMNAGKSRYNEDEAACFRGRLIRDSEVIKYTYVGLFDGHGGPGAAVKAIKEMHQIIHEGLEDVLDQLLGSTSSFEMQFNTTLHHKTNGLEGNEKR